MPKIKRQTKVMNAITIPNPFCIKQEYLRMSLFENSEVDGLDKLPQATERLTYDDFLKFCTIMDVDLFLNSKVGSLPSRGKIMAFELNVEKSIVAELQKLGPDRLVDVTDSILILSGSDTYVVIKYLYLDSLDNLVFTTAKEEEVRWSDNSYAWGSFNQKINTLKMVKEFVKQKGQ